MHFHVEQVEPAFLPREVRVGDVYQMKGGPVRGVWVVVMANDRKACVLGVNRQGEICSAQSYAIHAFQEREPIAFCHDVSELVLTISSLDKP